MARERHRRAEWAGVVCAWGLALGAAAEGVDLALETENDSFLQFEPVMAFVTLHNDSETELKVDPEGGPDAGAVSFEVKRYTLNRTETLKPAEGAPKARRLAIPSGGRQPIMTDLSLLYELNSMGRYSVIVRLDWRGHRYESPLRSFEIVHGIELARAAGAVPGYPDRLLGYSLRYWTRRGREYLFLSVEDVEEDVNYGVFTLGPIMRVSKPVLRVGRDGTVVVVHRSGRDMHTRSVLVASGEGVRLVDQAYYLPDGRPYPEVRGRESTNGPGAEASVHSR